MATLPLNAELQQYMSIISEDENLLKRATKYLRKLVAEKQSDPTEMTREEFYAKLDKAKKQIERGDCTQFTDKEAMNKWLNSL
ncbi:MAG: hypothetical protein IJS20_03935 [Bacteroidales bacterium]|nr:hypothetical protein [Bacteroidales bacterium]